MRGATNPILAALSGAVLCLAGSSPSIAAESNFLWVRIGHSAAEMGAALEACKREAKSIEADHIPDPSQARLVNENGLLPVAINMLIDAAETGKARKAYIDDCMLGRGFIAISLNSEDERQLETEATRDARLAWIDHFYERPDFKDRVAAAIATGHQAGPGPRLLQAVDEPMMAGPFHLNIADLTVSSGVIAEGQTVLAGRAGHRRTARVAADVDFRDSIHFHLAVGSILHEVVADGRQGRKQTYWCGLIGGTVLWRKAQYNHCVWGAGNELRMWFNAGDPYIDGQPEAGDDMDIPSSTVYALEPSPTDLLGPIDFRLVVKHIGRGGITLEAVADHNGPHLAWTSDVLFDDDGHAVLPFWTHRLIFTRSGNGVIALLTSDGDGRGWDDADAGAVQ
jgi:hypothetical protein